MELVEHVLVITVVAIGVVGGVLAVAAGVAMAKYS